MAGLVQTIHGPALRKRFQSRLKENPRKHGKKIKADGSEIQIFSFRQSRLFNGLCRESKKRRSTLGLGVIIKQPIEAKKITRQRLLVRPDVDLEYDDSRHDSTAF